MRNGKHIVVDGIAPAKTALIQMLAKQLEAVNVPTQVLQTNVGTDQNASTEAINRLIHDPAYPLHNRAEVLLYNALQAQSGELVRTIAEQGTICLSSESYLTTLVSEYYGKGIITDYNAASTIMQFAVADTQPDLLILLDASVSAVAAQQPQVDQALLERLRAGYLWEANQRNIPVLYTTDDLTTVFQQIWGYVAQTLSLSYELYTQVASTPLDFSLIETVSAIEAPTVSPAPTAAPVEAEASQAIQEPVEQPTVEVTPEPPSVPQNEEPETVPPTTPVSILASEQLAHDSIDTGLQKSLLHIPYEQKDDQGHYRYYIPENLRGKVRSQYIRTMNQQFTAYSELFQSLSEYLRGTAGTPKAKRDAAWEGRLHNKTRQLLQPVLPVAATLQALEHLAATGPEEKAAMPVATPKHQAVQQLIAQALPSGYTFTTQPVTLTSYQPRNELDVAAALLYPHSDLPLQALQQTIASWPYDQKVAAITTALSAQKADSTPFTSVTYSFDLITDYATFRLLQQHRFGVQSNRQVLTPRYGYSTPGIFEEAGLSEQLDDCFDRSLELYSALQASQWPELAPYGTLLGHKIRWNTTCTLADIMRLRHSFDITTEMAEKIQEVHPLITELLNDPSL